MGLISALMDFLEGFQAAEEIAKDRVAKDGATKNEPATPEADTTGETQPPAPTV
jgi:hypothetical protein